MCGIFGWAGKDPKKFNKAKFDIQGLYNNSRGGDSCGVTTDGEIYYGAIAGRKNYDDFLVENNYDIPKLIPTVFGHTRKSSHGVVNANNAHPFGFGDHNDGYKFIGCHNGTLHNHKQLAATYNVEESIFTINDRNIKILDRNKIDSEILLEAIYNSHSFHPLEDYIGGAAVIFTDTEFPNIIYAFHGASRKDEDDDPKKIVEERPLFYYIENKNSLYISSLAESLIAIGGEINENIFEFECNVVYKITNGDIKNAETFKINRSKSHQSAYSRINWGHGPNFSMIGNSVDRYKKMRNKQSSHSHKKNKKDLLNFDVTNIYEEKEERLFKSPIIFSNLRYKRNGHKAEGIFTWVSEYGLIYLTHDASAAQKEVIQLMDIPFCMKEGSFIRSKQKQSELNYNSDDIIIPFQTIKHTTAPLLYIYDGILLQYETDYLALVNKFKEKFTFEDLSRMSKHPIIDTRCTFRPSTNQEILKDGELFTGNICPLGSKKIYDIENGNLMSITMRDEAINNDSSVIALPLNTMCHIKQQDDETFINNTIRDFVKETQGIKEIVDFIATEDDEIDEDPILEVPDDSLALEVIDKLMTPIYVNLQEAEIELKKYNTHECVKNVLEANNDYLISLNELINV